jgi:predicted dehydrogenase
LRLVTARGYEPFSYPDNIGTIDPSRGLLLFLLELTTKMRLDKFEGMGDTTWAGNGFVTAAVEGFFQALKTKEIQGERGSIKVDDFMASVKALSQNDIEELIRLQLDEYQARDTSDYGVIMAHLEEHAQDLITALRHFSPSMR